MPLIKYICSCKKTISKFFRGADNVPPIFLCVCGLEAKRQLGSPSASSIVTIDNGLMAKSLDVNLEIVENNEGNSTKDFSDWKDK
jgi:hypothetical protein